MWTILMLHLNARLPRVLLVVENDKDPDKITHRNSILSLGTWFAAFPAKDKVNLTLNTTKLSLIAFWSIKRQVTKLLVVRWLTDRPRFSIHKSFVWAVVRLLFSVLILEEFQSIISIVLTLLVFDQLWTFFVGWVGRANFEITRQAWKLIAWYVVDLYISESLPTKLIKSAPILSLHDLPIDLILVLLQL